MSEVRRLLRIGVVSGCAAGAAGAVHHVLVTEPVLARAIAWESERSGHHHGEPLVSRTAQQVGGVLTLLVVAALVGVVFAGVMHLARTRLPDDPLASAMAMSGLMFVALGVLPAIKTPASPPGVGDPASVEARTLAYLLVVALGMLWAITSLVLPATLHAHRRTRDHARVGAVIGATAAAVLLLALTPGLADPIPDGYPADLVWDFRVASLGQTLVMALSLPIAFALVADSEGRTRRARRPAPVA